ncbi:MAG TPA: tRNA (adenosine(37)-N6)-threonylcarbamoyltransferase complex dimerization subunit type 1 TsaB [Vicinamibacterales bacterium]|nr:tRNA (adenosine(37)-N6)-threonylcarbamoyltransferase complex dimerization subunit type 1 TsaB [Vicinamibacterales bacterium]
MLILALDTTTRAGSLAVVRDGEVVHEMTGDPMRPHGQRLPLDVVAACASAGVALAEIDLFAVATGPGSFTGLRVGIAAIQGLAFATGRSVVPVSTLEAIAVAARSGGCSIAAWMDAQRSQVYAQRFEVRASPGCQLMGRGTTRALAASPEDVLAAWRSDGELRDVQFHGDGAARYADRIRAVLGPDTFVATEAPPLAGAIGRIAAAEPGRAVLPHAIVPVYVRRPDVELARERREGSG